MPSEQTKAVVLRIIEFSETSLVVTLLTRELGRVTAIAKGARRPKGPFEGSLDLLAVCRVVVIRKRGDNLDLLTEAKLLRRFRGGERSLGRTYAGYYVAELLRLVTEDHDPHADLYDLTIRTLGEIDGSGDCATALAYFDAQTLRIVGLQPGTDRCTGCGGTVPDSPRVAFSFDAGGIVCHACRPHQSRSVSLRRGVLDLLRHLQAPETDSSIPIDPALYGEFRSVMNRYIESQLGVVPRMQPFLPNAIRTEPTA